MKVREAVLILPFALGLLAAPPPAEAQKAGKVARIGFLGGSSPSRAAHLVEALRRGLRDLDYAGGQNVAIEYRFAEGRSDRLPGLAADLVRLKVDVIVTASTPAARAAKHATSTIPIVMAIVGDPVRTGLIASLARPGGNVTRNSGLESTEQVRPGAGLGEERFYPAYALSLDSTKKMLRKLVIAPELSGDMLRHLQNIARIHKKRGTIPREPDFVGRKEALDTKLLREAKGGVY
ncbi:MAG: ABC transporter substrate binding protein [Candidatus Methylomirabilia bacterium]